jgi:hypothetical protein
MTINALTPGSAGTLAYTSRVSTTSPASSAQQAGGMRPPPDDGGGFIGAIADALKSIGIDGGDAAMDATSTDGDTGDTAQALGGFLENLMGALHAQNTDGAGAAPAYGEAPQGGPGMGGGPGRLSADLQSLISALGDGAEASVSTGAGEAGASVSALQSSFKDLLASLGGDGGDADAKLSGFLQALAAKLPSAGSAGNLIDTTA